MSSSLKQGITTVTGIGVAGSATAVASAPCTASAPTTWVDSPTVRRPRLPVEPATCGMRLLTIVPPDGRGVRRVSSTRTAPGVRPRYVAALVNS